MLGKSTITELCVLSAPTQNSQSVNESVSQSNNFFLSFLQYLLTSGPWSRTHDILNFPPYRSFYCLSVLLAQWFSSIFYSNCSAEIFISVLLWSLTPYRYEGLNPGPQHCAYILSSFVFFFLIFRLGLSQWHILGSNLGFSCFSIPKQQGYKACNTTLNCLLCFQYQSSHLFCICPLQYSYVGTTPHRYAILFCFVCLRHGLHT